MLLIALIIIYSSFRISRVVVKKRKEITTLTFWIFVYIFLGIVPLIQVANGAFSWSDNYDDIIIIRATIIVLWGILAFDVGYYMLSSKRVESFANTIFQRNISKTSVVCAGIIALILSTFFLIYVGDITYLFNTRDQRFRNMEENFEKSEMLLFNTLEATPLFVASLSAMAIWIASHRGLVQKVGIKWKLMTIALLLGTFIINNPISTGRYMVGTITLSFLFLLPWKRSAGVIVAVFLLIGGLLIIFPIADVFRYDLDSSIIERLSSSSVIEDLTLKGDFDAFQQLANSILVADAQGLQFGRQLSGSVFFWFPRSIWLTKPLATGEFIAEEVGYQFTNLSSPLWAEFYTDGGILLVIVGFVLYGVFVRMVDQCDNVSDQQPGIRVITIFMPIFASYQIFLLRGALMPSLSYFIPMVLYLVLLSNRRKS